MRIEEDSERTEEDGEDGNGTRRRKKREFERDETRALRRTNTGL